jgi:hypothetical protein
VKSPYSFSVLRYIHDPVTQEFANVGIVLYSKEANYVDAKCTTSYARLSRIFTTIDGNRFRQITRFLEGRVHAIGQSIRSQLRFEDMLPMETLLSSVLPPDDSAFQFSPVGVGLSKDLDKTLSELFDRFVERYSGNASPKRDDEDVWKVFRGPLERRNVASKLTPKTIVAPNYEYEFEHSWKNESWHLYEPVSFDLVDPGSILDKANRWVGRATSLADSKEPFKIHMLIGETRESGLRNTFIKAQNILNKMPGKKELIKENEAEAFAEELAGEIQSHSGE